MTAPAEGRPPASEAEAEAHMAAQPARGQAERGRGADGSAQGTAQGGRPGVPNARGDGAGVNAQSGAASSAENERIAPGISTDKKADDTK